MVRHADNPSPQLSYVGDHFEQFQRNGCGWKARCPLHDDENPSLSLNEGANGGVVLQCHAGCPTGPILDVVGLRFADLKPGARRIDATYPYRDEAGDLLFEVVRYEPKDFRQRRPKPGGGWIYNTKGARRVLYRLPELLAADQSKPVFIVAGEKDADRLAAIDLVTTTNVGGEGPGKWLQEYNEPLVGRHVVIIPDNDSTGWEHARNVAAQLYGVAASVKVLELTGLPEHGDVSDWLDARGRRPQLLGLVNRTPHYAPLTHRPSGRGENPLGNTVGSAQRVANTPAILGVKPDGSDPMGSSLDAVGKCQKRDGSASAAGFPVEVFPASIRHHIESIAAAMSCPPDYAGATILAVASAFIGRRRCVEVKPGWVEYPVLWIVVVARSGDRKTPVFLVATAPLRTKQRELLAEYISEKRRWEALPPDQRRDMPCPKLKQLIATDSTIEALKDVLSNNPNGIAYINDELTGWVRSMSQYKGGRGDDRQHWLSIYSLVQIVCNRKGAEPIIINDPFVSVTGGIQPDVLGDLVDEAREDGFASRLLFAYPETPAVADWNENVIAESTMYAGVCDTLYNLDPAKPLTLSPEAKARWIEWVNRHRHETVQDSLRPTWAKAEGQCARLALVLFELRRACNETHSEQVDETSLKGAIQLIEYFKAHASARFWPSRSDLRQRQSRQGDSLDS